MKKWRVLGRGLTRRCPRCGGRRLFRRWFSMLAACPTCGLHFEREEGFFLGAFVVNLAVTEVVLAAFLVGGFVLTSPDPPVVLLAAGAAAVSLLTPLAVYPFSKTLWAAIDYLAWPRPDPLRDDSEHSRPESSRNGEGPSVRR